MRRSIPILLALLVGIPWTGFAASESGPLDLRDRYIVVFNDHIPEGEVARKVRDFERRLGFLAQHRFDTVIKGFAAKLGPAALRRLRQDPGVNHIVPDEPVRALCHTSPQEIPTGVQRQHGLLAPTARIDSVDERVNADIAVLDTGVAPHPDLNLVVSVDCTRTNCPSISPIDPNSHGTHVAGTAAALDNATGVVGVAPGARIWSVRILNNAGFGSTSTIIAGVNFVTKYAPYIEVANLSVGGLGRNTGSCGIIPIFNLVIDPMHLAICRSVVQGVVYTVAAGNESRDAARSVPAAYPEVITVSALADSDGVDGGVGPGTGYGPDDSLASFSNFGSIIDLIAPGVSIDSTVPADALHPIGGCDRFSGTSMAAPHAAGAVALYLATHPKPTNPFQVDAVRHALRSAGDCPNGSAFGTSGCSTTWPNDPDGITEPLVNVTGF